MNLDTIDYSVCCIGEYSFMMATPKWAKYEGIEQDKGIKIVCGAMKSIRKRERIKEIMRYIMKMEAK